MADHVGCLRDQRSLHSSKGWKVYPLPVFIISGYVNILPHCYYISRQFGFEIKTRKFVDKCTCFRQTTVRHIQPKTADDG